MILLASGPSRDPQEASRESQETPRYPQETSKNTPGDPLATIQDMGMDALKLAQDIQGAPQDGSKMATMATTGGPI